MKKILIADYIYTPEKLLKNNAVLFDETIIQIAPKSKVLKENKGCEVIEFGKNSLLFPGLINAHVHVEFSANKTQLSYGDFINWLYSVIENREELMASCDKNCMKKAIESMLESGITTFGAISSHGIDLEVCKEAKQNVVFFNELIGSQAAAADVLYGDFLQRFEASKAVQRKGFYPAVAIHSPYSVHPVLIKKALEFVKEHSLKLTAHFMESDAEREWLDTNSGDFQKFFQSFLKQERAVTNAQEFLESFENIPTLFAHVVKATNQEYENLKKNSHTIIHCPISNRLLGNGAIDLAKVDAIGVNLALATDGLSSNYKLDLWEEMKVALFMHSEFALLELAQKLLDGVTKNPAIALGLKKGQIKEGYDADMIVLQLQTPPNEELPIHLILHRYPIVEKFINGEKI
jgi:cytosine/adenosine deaminase-related metal-dependent hydrolase